jgi:hypothetical protein
MKVEIREVLDFYKRDLHVKNVYFNKPVKQCFSGFLAYVRYNMQNLANSTDSTWVLMHKGRAVKQFHSKLPPKSTLFQ